MAVNKGSSYREHLIKQLDKAADMMDINMHNRLLQMLHDYDRLVTSHQINNAWVPKTSYDIAMDIDWGYSTAWGTNAPFEETLDSVLHKINTNPVLEDNGFEGSHIKDWPKWAEIIKRTLIQDWDDAFRQHTYQQAFQNPFQHPYNYYKGNTMPKAQITFDKSVDCYDIKFVYHSREWNIIQSIVALMKGSIPAGQRAWDPSTKTWSVASVAYPICKQIFSTIKMEIEELRPVSTEGFFYEDAVSTPAAPSKNTLAERVKKLLGITDVELADNILLKKAYRKKAMELHPDRNNGDGSKMSELNEVYNAYTSS